MAKKNTSESDSTTTNRRLRGRVASLEAELHNLHALFKKHFDEERKKAEAEKAAHEVEIAFLKGQIALLRAKLERP
jgi:hypothetical protein